MNKKKSVLILVVMVVLLIFLVSGGTYAWFIAVTNEANVDSKSGELVVNYNKPGPLTGKLMPSSSRSGGLTTSASASLGTSSVDALFNMYIIPTSINSLDIAALRWEVEATRNNIVVDECSSSGNFAGVSANAKVNMISGCPLTTDTTTFNVYIWLDESLITESINSADFKASIGADSVPITGEF